MQSKTDERVAETNAYETHENQPTSFGLYEEYSRRDMDETTRTRQEAYERADYQTREDLRTEVEIEVENFHIWLNEAKKLEPFAAHYYSVSLKSLLLGLPIGKHVARLFEIALRMKDRKQNG
jgi:hypothetical protein